MASKDMVVTSQSVLAGSQRLQKVIYLEDETPLHVASFPPHFHRFSQ